MNWFAKNGDKLLGLSTAVLALMVTQAAALGLNAHGVAWATFISGVGALAHSLYFPNSQVVAPSATSSNINVGKGS